MRKNKVYQVSDTKFIEIVNNSATIRQALLLMGLKGKGGNYEVFHKRCKKLNIKINTINKSWKNIRLSISNQTIIDLCTKFFSRQSVLLNLELNFSSSNIRWIDKKINELEINISHWTGQGHLKGKTHNWSSIIPLSEVLCENSTYSNMKNLKKRLVKSELLEYKCNRCSISTWNNEQLALHLDHFNGIRTDNRLENLRLLCPNCHSQTDTYCGRNIGKHKR